MKLVIKLVRLALLLLLPLFSCINSSQLISVFLQRCTGNCNKKYCNLTYVCRPLNRTSKWTSLDIYFHKGVKLEAPINVEIIANKKFRTAYQPHMIRLKEELCALLAFKTHPLFKQLGAGKEDENLYDPCPWRGHRYLLPEACSPSTMSKFPLIPVGEWRIDIILSKTVNDSDELIVRWSDYYDVKPTGVVEF